MRLNWITAVLASSVAVSGCGPGTSGDSRPPNPAADVSREFSTFSIQDKAGLPQILPNTVFYDFYAGLEPADGEDDQNTSTAIRQRLDQLMGLTPSDNKTTYDAARNPIDFLNFVINSNLIGNFNEGRQLIHNVISDGVPAYYNTPQNDAIIRFTETEGEAPDFDRLWVYPVLDWRNTVRPGKVVTTRQFVARAPADESKHKPEVQSMQWQARIEDSIFSVSGYNQPDLEVLSVTALTLGNAELRKEYVGRKMDTFFLTKPSSKSESQDGLRCENVPPEDPLNIMIGGENPDCVRVEIDYPKSQVRVFTSRGEAPITEDCRAFNANYCGNQRAGNGVEVVIYNSITIDSRQ